MMYTSIGGAGRCPGTISRAISGLEAIAGVLPWDLPHLMVTLLPLISSLLKVFSEASSAEDLLVNWINAQPANFKVKFPYKRYSFKQQA